MKPKILNLLSDERMGGVKTSLNSLMNSRLQENLNLRSLVSEFSLWFYDQNTVGIRIEIFANGGLYVLFGN